MYAIWDFENDDWVRELPSKVDDGGIAFLCFDKLHEAHKRAAKHWGFDRYQDARRAGWCEVCNLRDGPPSEDLRAELKAKIEAKATQ